jgi:cbb3-type cytochrome oxidase subunit 3
MIAFLVEHSGVIGLVLFVVFFAFVVARLYRPGAKQVYDRFANIPLMEDRRDE